MYRGLLGLPATLDKARLDNLTATSAPTVNDDSGDGYAVGSRWLWAARGFEWVALSVGSGAARWELVQSAANILGARSLVFYDDFISFPVPATTGALQNLVSSVWGGVTGGTAATVDAAPISTDSVRGIRRLTTGTTSSGHAAIQQWSWESFAFGTVAQWSMTNGLILPTPAPNGTETYFAHWGYSFSEPETTAPTGQANAAAFLYRWTGSAAELVSVTRRSGGSVQSTVLTAPSDGLTHAYTVIVPSSGNVLFLIDGAQVASHSTRPSETAGVRTLCAIVKSAGSTARSLDLDYMLLTAEGIR